MNNHQMNQFHQGMMDHPPNGLTNLPCFNDDKATPTVLSGTSTGTETTFSCTESSAASSTSTLRNDTFHIELREIVKSKLDPGKDAKKIKTIGYKGKSIKFPVKLMYILEECPQFNHIISWSEDGLYFIISDQYQLEKEVLPSTFKGAKFNSFLRKLYRWGFTKRTQEGKECAYINEKFRKGDYSLCMDMSCANPSIANSKQLRQEIQVARLAVETVQKMNNLQNAQLMDRIALQQQQNSLYQFTDLNNIPNRTLSSIDPLAQTQNQVGFGQVYRQGGNYLADSTNDQLAQAQMQLDQAQPNPIGMGQIYMQEGNFLVDSQNNQLAQAQMQIDQTQQTQIGLGQMQRQGGAYLSDPTNNQLAQAQIKMEQMQQNQIGLGQMERQGGNYLADTTSNQHLQSQMQIDQTQQNQIGLGQMQRQGGNYLTGSLREQFAQSQTQLDQTQQSQIGLGQMYRRGGNY